MFLVIANWKMNGNFALAAEFNAGVKPKNTEVVICPPFHLINSINPPLKRGAQNCHLADSGAHTGEVCAGMLKELGAEYVIIGHSERREAGETSAHIAKKVIAAQKSGLKVILCVGEKDGEDLEAIVKEQLKELPENKNNIIIAYEPVWAIGSGRTPSNADIAKAHAYIKNLSGLNVIYGGSVKPENTAEIANTAGVSGLLIGGASLSVESLNKIIEAI